MMQFISCTINAHFVNFVPRARRTAGAYRLLARGINGRTERGCLQGAVYARMAAVLKTMVSMLDFRKPLWYTEKNRNCGCAVSGGISWKG